jgi:hypothetical protein
MRLHEFRHRHPPDGLRRRQRAHLPQARPVPVTAPAGWIAASNQPQAHVERTLDDSQTVRFLPTPALPTFTTIVVAGDYHVATAMHTTPDGRRIPLELACRADLARDPIAGCKSFS